MSIKQGEYLKKLRAQNGLSQEQLAEKLGLSRQSISKWEQGTSTPDIDNFIRLSELYGVSIEDLLRGGPLTDGNASQSPEKTPPPEKTAQSVKNDIPFQEPYPKQVEKRKKKRSWVYPAYPVIAVIVYAVIGALFGAKGWAYGWTVLLTIPLFYTGIIASEKKKPVIFCYPALVLMVYLLCGFLFKLWHPMWILFLTIPVFYIAAAKHGKK